MQKTVLLVAIAGVVSADKVCGVGYTDDKCANAVSGASECFSGCHAQGIASAKAVCSGDSITLYAYLNNNCAEPALGNSTVKAGVCTKGTMSDHASVQYVITTCGSCFALDDVAELEGGQKVQFSSLKVGDRVLAVDGSGTLVYSPIIRFGHRSSGTRAFKRFLLASGES